MGTVVYDIKPIIMCFSQKLQQDAKVLPRNQKNNSYPSNLTHLVVSLYVKGVKFHLHCEYIRLKSLAQHHRSSQPCVSV